MENEQKRLFFGFEVKAPWPSTLPPGRLLEEEHRHLTLAFLGNIPYLDLKKRLSEIPLPDFKVGVTAKFDQCLFLPPHHSRCVAWHVTCFENLTPLVLYQKTLKEWLQGIGLSVETRHDFNPHVTLARAPFDKETWEKQFSTLPLILTDLHLYESKGHLEYVSVWKHPLQPPFEEIEHTADLAYHVYGESFDQLFHHAQIALAFSFPQILPFFSQKTNLKHLEDVILALNQIVFEADKEIGIPFKAVSYHNHLEKYKSFMKWEMIVDV